MMPRFAAIGLSAVGLSGCGAKHADYRDDGPGVEVCDDGIDNDCDNNVDCSDNECSNAPVCQTGNEPEICDDGIDNDGDGVPELAGDCDDSNPLIHPAAAAV